MLKLCKNHSKSFKVPFGGGGKKERKKEKTEWFFFLFCVRSLLPSLPCFPFSILVCFFPPQSSFVIIPFHPPFRPSPPPPPPLTPSFIFWLLPPISTPFSLSLFLSYSLHFLLLLSIKLWQPTETKRITTQGIGIWLL